MIEEQRPELESFFVGFELTGSGDDIHTVKRWPRHRVQGQLDGHVRHAHPFHHRIASLSSPGARPPACRVSIKHGTALRMNQTVRLKVRVSGLLGLVIRRAGIHQQTDDIGALCRSTASPQVPAVPKTSPGISFIVIFWLL